MCIPTLIAYASKEITARYVKPALHGEEIWCQLFSEPSAARTSPACAPTRSKDGDDWIINGQKVWTTGAHYSDYGIAAHAHRPERAQAQGSDHVLPVE